MSSRRYVVQVLWLTVVCVKCQGEARGGNPSFLADAVSVVGEINQQYFIPGSRIVKSGKVVKRTRKLLCLLVIPVSKDV
jgi:hypothetical protein